MNEIFSLIAAGTLIPAISVTIKIIVIDGLLNRVKREISITDAVGKEFKIVMNATASNDDLRKAFESEVRFESEVKRHLDSFIRTHKNYDLQLSSGNKLDFLLECNSKRIGIEAKANPKQFKAKWIYEYFENNNDIDELIMIIDSKVPESFLLETSKNEIHKKIKFISSPRGKGLSKSIENVLWTELNIKNELEK